MRRSFLCLAGVRQPQDGNLDRRIILPGSDPLSEATSTVNTFAERLQRLTDNMDAKVARRTATLERKAGQLRAVGEVGRQVATVPTWTWVTSRIISSGLLSFFNGAVILVLGRFFLHAHLNYRIETPGLVIVAGTYAFLGLGLSISALVNRVEAVQPLNAILIIVMQFLGEFWFPVTAPWTQPVAKLMPTHWLSHAFRQVMLYRAPLCAVTADVAVLGAILVVTSPSPHGVLPV